MSRKDWISFLVVVIVVWVVGMWFLLKMDLFRQEYNRFEDRGVPRINIDLKDVSLDEIKEGSKDVKYKGNELQVYDDYTINSYRDVEIKGRGNGTWVQDKKPYQIKFKDKVDFFGMGKAKKWYLLTNAMDPSNLRNDIAFSVAKMLGMKYGFDGKFVELYVNNDYEGIYYVTHAVEIGKHTVDLNNQFGILVELDNYYGVSEDNYKTDNGDLLVVKDYVSEDYKEKATKDFLEQYNRLEVAIEKKDYGEISKLIDIESFAQYFLLSEFSVNPDAYWTSFFMYKNGMNDKIHVGPGWDYDSAFGNRVWGNWMGERFYSPTETMIRKEEIKSKEFYDQEGIENGYETSLQLSTILFDLMEIPEFRQKVKEIFKAKMSGRETELMSSIEGKVEEIKKAAEADDKRWGRKDEGDIEKLKEWIGARYQYFEQEYN